MIAVTIDTNVIISGMDGNEEQKQALSKLLEYHQREIMRVKCTTRFEADKQEDKNQDRRLRHKQMASNFDILGTAGRMGQTIVGNGDFSISEREAEIISQIESILGVHSERDADHIFGHWKSGADYFLTYENDKMLKKKIKWEKIGIRIMNPIIFVETVETARNQVSSAAELDTLLPSNLDRVFKGKL